MIVPGRAAAKRRRRRATAVAPPYAATERRCGMMSGGAGDATTDSGVYSTSRPRAVSSLTTRSSGVSGSKLERTSRRAMSASAGKSFTTRRLPGVKRKYCDPPPSLDSPLPRPRVPERACWRRDAGVTTAATSGRARNSPSPRASSRPAARLVEEGDHAPRGGADRVARRLPRQPRSRSPRGWIVEIGDRSSVRRHRTETSGS